jgi:hypothetical protein
MASLPPLLPVLTIVVPLLIGVALGWLAILAYLVVRQMQVPRPGTTARRSRTDW